MDDNKKTKAKLWNTRLFALLFFVSLGGALIGVILKGTDAVVKGNKDTKTADATAANTMSRALLTKDDEPIGVNQNEVELSFGSLKHMPEYGMRHASQPTTTRSPSCGGYDFLKSWKISTCRWR